MGRKLDQYFDQLTVKLRLKAGEHLEELERRTSRGEVPSRTVRKRVDGVWVDVPRTAEERHHDMLALENTLRVHLGTPQLERRILVEVEPGTTWESALLDLKRAKHPETSVAPFEIPDKVRALQPEVRPGIYEIFWWTDPSGDGDGPMTQVINHFKERDAEGWLIPMVQWCASSTGTAYWHALVPYGKDQLTVPENKLLVFRNYQGVYLTLEECPKQGAAGMTTGTGLYIGAKFIQ